LKPQGETGQSPISFTSAAGEEEPTLDAEQLVQLVKESTGGETAWAEPNSIEHHEGQFLVNATRELHAKIQDVLSNLRKDSDLFVVIEARFIDITDDFLEDIGIDSRALGAVNNWGTPFGNVINDNRTGGQDIGFVRQGSPVRDVTLIMGQDRWAGRIRHIIDGFTGTVRSQRGLTAGSGIGGLTFQGTWLEPFQINVILRAVQERSDVRQLTAPVVTAHNGQRVFASVITQRAYIADYNLVSGGTGFAIIEVADPEVQTFQEGVILDVDPVVSHDKKYITLDVRPTLATLRNGIISTILISLGSFTNVAFMVPIGIPQISLQQSFTSVTVPNGGTVLLGGFKSLNEAKYTSYLPIIGRIPLIGNLFRRKATLSEKRSLVILLSARIVDLRGEEGRKFNE
jgi:general secretion pathway protein D